MSDNGQVFSPAMGRGVLVFLSGMALAGLSFVVEEWIVKTAQGRG